MTGLIAMVLSGALIALGITVVVLHFVAPARVDPVSVLTALTPRAGGPLGVDAPGPPSDRIARLGTWAMRNLPDELWTRTPEPELRLLQIPRARFYGEKIAFAGLGLVIPPAVAAFFGVLELDLPWVIPTLGSLALATAMFFTPNYNAIVAARKARTEFRSVLAAYIDALALERTGGSAVRQAMEHAAVGDHWVYTRLAEELARSRWSGVPAWDALDALADELALPELGEVADILRLAGENGTAAWDSLRARSTALRNALLNDELAQANADGERLSMPASLLGVTFIALLIAPALLRIFLRT